MWVFSPVASQFFEGGFARVPVLGIVRASSVQQVVADCVAAWDSGVRLVEIPMRGPLALDVLRAAVSAGRERGLPVGAGTVYNKAGLDAVFAAGAAYAVAPGLDLELVRFAARVGMPYLPGVATPGEVQAAVNAGCQWLKMFPAQVLGDVWLRAMVEVFPDVRFVATGGIGQATAKTMLDAGAAAVGVGTCLNEVVSALTNLSAAPRPYPAKTVTGQS